MQGWVKEQAPKQQAKAINFFYDKDDDEVGGFGDQ